LQLQFCCNLLLLLLLLLFFLLLLFVFEVLGFGLLVLKG
jgi:hypothetical protein